MKFRSMSTWLIVLVVTICSLAVLGSSRAQVQSTERRVKEVLKDPNQQYQLYQKVQQAQEQAEVMAKAVAGVRPRKTLADSIRKAAEAVRDADGDEAKSVAQKNLTGLLGQYFDDDMVRREQELAQIEERLVKLRELLDRRRTKKQEILELQTKVALYEAEGLGFYDSESSGKAKPGAYFNLKVDPFTHGPELVEDDLFDTNATRVEVPVLPDAAGRPAGPPVPTSPQPPVSR